MSDSFETVMDGELTKFETEGTVVQGVLQNYKTQQTKKGLGHVYEVKTKDGVSAFFAPSLLQEKLSKIAIGKIVIVTYKGMQKSNSGNDYKVFDVKHAPVNAANLAIVGMSMEDTGFAADGEI